MRRRCLHRLRFRNSHTAGDRLLLHCRFESLAVALQLSLNLRTLFGLPRWQIAGCLAVGIEQFVLFRVSQSPLVQGVEVHLGRGKRFCSGRSCEKVFNLAVRDQESVLLELAVGDEGFNEAFFRPGVQRFHRLKVSELSCGSRGLAHTLGQSRNGAIERAGYIGIPVDTTNFQDTRPGFLCGFWSSVCFRAGQRLKNLRNLREKLARPERSVKESFQDRGVHAAEGFQPKRKFGRDIFLVLDAEAKKPLPN